MTATGDHSYAVIHREMSQQLDQFDSAINRLESKINQMFVDISLLIAELATKVESLDSLLATEQCLQLSAEANKLVDRYQKPVDESDRRELPSVQDSQTMDVSERPVDTVCPQLPVKNEHK